MASGGQRVDLRRKFSSVTPSFFKIIQEDTLLDKKIMIPKKFMRKYGDTLSDPIVLELPCGLEWKVELSDDKGSFDKGWKEFSDYYSLEFGHMLLFRYERNSLFHVFIFDKSTSEIDYPTNSTLIKNPVEETKDVDSVEILYESSPCHKTRDKSPLPCLTPQKRMKTTPIDETQSKLCHLRHKGVHTQCKKAILKNSMNEKDSYQSKSRMRGGRDKSSKRKQMKSEDHRRAQHLTAEEKAIALQIASDFKSEKPFFMVALQPSYFKQRSGLNVELQFAKKYLSNMPANVILKDLNGRTWPVKTSFEVCGKTTQKIVKTRFTTGWTVFAEHNNLEVGDVCAFVLERGTETSFEVFIFRNNGISNSPTSPVHKAATIQAKKKARLSNEPKPDNTMATPRTWLKPKVLGAQQTLTTKEKAKAPERASAFKSEKPFFAVSMYPSHIRGTCRLHMPYKFAKTYINKNESEIILRVSNGGSWSVHYITRERPFGSPVAELCDGWKKFVQDNNLEVGDVCIFELINGNEISFRVSITQAAGGEHKKLSLVCREATKAVKQHTNVRVKIESGCTSNNEMKMSPMVDPFSKKEPAAKFRMLKSEENTHRKGFRKPLSSSGNRAYEAARQFFSENPYFLVSLRSSHLKRMAVPMAFCKSNFEHKTQTVTLQVEERSWPVKMIAQKYEFVFSRGLAAFLRDTSLCLGDVCVFELINPNPVVLKVCIFPSTG
ncbi:hypothetical protein UlMin_006955 [Ulmus minor]